MKKIISCIAIAVMLFACSKQESPVPSEQGSSLKAKKGGGDSGPSVTTSYHSPGITYTSATAGGEVSKSGGGNNATERGVCYSTSPDPTTGDSKVAAGSGSGSFTCSLTGLAPATTYYIKAYAILSTGTYYGNQVTFSTLVPPVYGMVTDYDGNEYVTLTIGTQTWMMENLKAIHYSNGDPIQNVTSASEWSNLKSAEEKGAWCSYQNVDANIETYGRLYNWYAASDPRNIAPTGWHVPTKEDWDVLETYLGSPYYSSTIWEIGRKLKETGTDHWSDPNPADNISYFTALPGGQRGESGSFTYLNTLGRFWSSELFSGYAYFRSLDNTTENIVWLISGALDNYRTMGLSVRCVKD